MVLTYTEAGGPTIGIGGNVLGLSFNGLPNGMSYSIDIALVDRDGALIQESFTGVVAFRNGQI